MKVLIFSPDGKNFCQFATPNLPKTRFWVHFHPGLLGYYFLYSPNLTLGLGWTHLGLGWAHLGLSRAYLGLGHGPPGPPRAHQGLGRGPPGPPQAHEGLGRSPSGFPRAHQGLGCDPPGPPWAHLGPEPGPTWASDMDLLGLRRGLWHVQEWLKPSKY